MRHARCGTACCHACTTAGAALRRPIGCQCRSWQGVLQQTLVVPAPARCTAPGSRVAAAAHHCGGGRCKQGARGRPGAAARGCGCRPAAAGAPPQAAEDGAGQADGWPAGARRALGSMPAGQGDLLPSRPSQLALQGRRPSWGGRPRIQMHTATCGCTARLCACAWRKGRRRAGHAKKEWCRLRGRCLCRWHMMRRQPRWQSCAAALPHARRPIRQRQLPRLRQHRTRTAARTLRSASSWKLRGRSWRQPVLRRATRQVRCMSNLAADCRSQAGVGWLEGARHCVAAGR